MSLLLHRSLHRLTISFCLNAVFTSSTVCVLLREKVYSFYQFLLILVEKRILEVQGDEFIDVWLGGSERSEWSPPSGNKLISKVIEGSDNHTAPSARGRRAALDKQTGNHTARSQTDGQWRGCEITQLRSHACHIPCWKSKLFKHTSEQLKTKMWKRFLGHNGRGHLSKQELECKGVGKRFKQAA